MVTSDYAKPEFKILECDWLDALAQSYFELCLQQWQGDGSPMLIHCNRVIVYETMYSWTIKMIKVITSFLLDLFK